MQDVKRTKLTLWRVTRLSRDMEVRGRRKREKIPENSINQKKKKKNARTRAERRWDKACIKGQ